MKYLSFILLILFACKKKKQDHANTTNPTAPVAACTPISGFQDKQWYDITNQPTIGEMIIFKSNGDYFNQSAVYGTWTLKGCDTIFIVDNALPNKHFFKVLFKNDTMMKTVWKNNFAGDTTRRWQTFKKMN